jgi:hypothetical protein
MSVCFVASVFPVGLGLRFWCPDMHPEVSSFASTGRSLANSEGKLTEDSDYPNSHGTARQSVDPKSAADVEVTPGHPARSSVDSAKDVWLPHDTLPGLLVYSLTQGWTSHANGLTGGLTDGGTGTHAAVCVCFACLRSPSCARLQILCLRLWKVCTCLQRLCCRHPCHSVWMRNVHVKLAARSPAHPRQTMSSLAIVVSQCPARCITGRRTKGLRVWASP